jgi:hypothetical protein
MVSVAWGHNRSVLDIPSAFVVEQAKNGRTPTISACGRER